MVFEFSFFRLTVLFFEKKACESQQKKTPKNTAKNEILKILRNHVIFKKSYLCIGWSVLEKSDEFRFVTNYCNILWWTFSKRFVLLLDFFVWKLVAIAHNRMSKENIEKNTYNNLITIPKKFIGFFLMQRLIFILNLEFIFDISIPKLHELTDFNHASFYLKYK